MFRSHVISWNLTRRCNLRCEHCYISAGKVSRDEAKGELSTEECLQVIDQLCEVNPEALLILTGGEPLLRPDVFEIARYAADKGLWPVVGTNGVKISERLCERMIGAGIKGVSLSLDALDAETHDRFRGVRGAYDNTVKGAGILQAAGLPFIVQTTVGAHNATDVPAIARHAHAIGARVFNLYFLVPTGRGSYISDITPEGYEEVLSALRALQEEFEGRMLVNSKCAPHYQRMLYEHDPKSPFLKSFGGGAGGCPAGTHYVGIRPNGDVTPCPYLPVFGGNLRQQTFAEIWNDSEIFRTIRGRPSLGGRCGPCEFNKVCGGCRARAYGASGDVMAEDPWCRYEPGAHGGQAITFDGGTTYGLDAPAALRWTDAAEARLRQIPSFVRGQVRERTEQWAREQGLVEITPAVMHRVREEVIGGRLGKAPAFIRKMLAQRAACDSGGPS